MAFEGLRTDCKRGLKFLVPVAFTFAIVIYAFSEIDSFFGGLIKKIIGEDDYLTGMGIAVGFVVIFIFSILVGKAITNFITGWFFSLVERIMERLPLVKWIFNSLRNAAEYFIPTEKKKMFKPVSVPILVRVLGSDGKAEEVPVIVGFFVTRDDAELKELFGLDEDSSVTYHQQLGNIGGPWFVWPTRVLRDINMTPLNALAFYWSGGATGPGGSRNAITNATAPQKKR